MNQFIVDANDDKVEENGWPKTAYGISKIGVSLATKLQQKQMDVEGRDVVVNSCCPGAVNTDMSGGHHAGMLTPDQGADTPTYLALLGTDDNVKGCFVKERVVRPYPPTEASTTGGCPFKSMAPSPSAGGCPFKK